MPKGKNAELEARTNLMQFATARVIAETHADGMRDGLDRAGDIILAAIPGLQQSPLDNTVTVAETIEFIKWLADTVRTQSHAVVAYEVDPADFNVPPVSEDDVKNTVRRFLDGK